MNTKQSTAGSNRRQANYLTEMSARESKKLNKSFENVFSKQVIAKMKKNLSTSPRRTGSAKKPKKKQQSQQKQQQGLIETSKQA